MVLPLIATGLGLAQGAKNLFSSNPGPAQQSYKGLKGAFKAADEAGIHRLAVAGSPAGYSPAPTAAADGLLHAGEAMRRGGKSPHHDKEGELIDAQIEEARSRTALNQANSRRALSGPQPGLGQFNTGLQRAFDNLSNGLDRAISREPERDQPATQTVTLGEHTARGPNPEPFEIGPGELMVGALLYGPQWAAKALDRGQTFQPHNRRSRGTGSPKPTPRGPSRGSRGRRN